MQSDGLGLAPTSSNGPLAFPPVLPALYGLLVGLVGLVVLGCQVTASRHELDWPAILVFAGLSFLVQRSSFHFGTPIVHSLAGVIDVAAVLALGTVAGATVAALSGFAYLELNALRRRRITRRSMVEIPLFNAGLKALIALLGGSLFEMLAGPLPLGSAGQVSAVSLDLYVILVVCVVCLVWFIVDHVGWGLLDYFEGGLERLRVFVRDAMPQAIYVELLPLPSGLIVALVYTQLGWPVFALVALAIIAVAVLVQRWANARNELVQRVAELANVDVVGRAIAEAQLDVDEVCRLVYEHASKIVDTTIFSLGLFHGDDYTLKLWIREGKAEPPRTFHMTPGVGLVNWLRETGQSIRVRDFEKEIDSLPVKPAYVAEDPPRSALFVPLVADETVIGTLSVQSFRRDAYGESDLRVLSAMANQAAVAIQKAQLYAQERKRVQQLETIAEVVSQVTATMELDELFRRVVHLIREDFGYYHVSIYAADRERQTVTFQASASAGEQDVAFEVEWGQGFIGWVAAQGRAVAVNDVDNDTRYRCVEALEETRSELAVPLVLEDELVGVLDVQSDQLNAFGSDDLFILETLGAQVALAIQEARLYEAERQQAWFSTALLQVVEAMSRLSDMDAVLTTIVRLTPLLAGVDRCAILLWDDDTETFAPAQTHGLSAELREVFGQMLFRPGFMPALDLVRLDKTPLLVNSVRDGKLIPGDMVTTFDIREMLLLPLLAQGELQGAMMVDYAGTSHAFSERMIDMLTGIAHQAAIVVQSARLVQAQREEAYVSMALLQVAEAVSRSTTLNEILDTVVRITPILVGVDWCAVYLRSEDSTAFLPVRQYGLRKEEQPVFWRMRFSEEDTPLRELLAGEEFVTVQGLEGHHSNVAEAAPSTAVANPLIAPLLGESSLLALPMVSKGDLLGTMIVDLGGPEQRFTQRWLNILSGIAGQAAIAVENDRLLKEAAEQERIKQELEVAERIQVSFLPENYPDIPGWELAAIWRSARRVGGDFYDFIPLPAVPGESGPAESRVGLVIADVADKGVPAALYMALSRTLVRTMAIDGRAPAEAIARANDLILSDARSDLFVTLFYTILQPDLGVMTYVNAGHMPPLLVRAVDGAVEELRTGGMALGVLSNIEFEEKTAHLAPGDTLILYTDGVTEATDANQRMFGRERLVELVSSHRTQSAGGMAQAINNTVAAFVGDVPQFDDFTLVVTKRCQA